MHFGTGPDEMETMSELDPYVIDDHLQEIEICSRVSKSIFFIVSSDVLFSIEKFLVKIAFSLKKKYLSTDVDR